MPKQSFADVIAEWEKLLATVMANKDDLQYVDAYRQQFEVEMAGAKAASIRQSTAQSDSQQASRDLEGFLTRGHDLAARLRAGIQSKYGKRSEKLKEFGMKVFRGKKKSSNQKPAPTPSPTPVTAPQEAPKPVPHASAAEAPQTHEETK